MLFSARSAAVLKTYDLPAFNETCQGRNCTMGAGRAIGGGAVAVVVPTAVVAAANITAYVVSSSFTDSNGQGAGSAVLVDFQNTHRTSGDGQAICGEDVDIVLRS